MIKLDMTIQRVNELVLARVTRQEGIVPQTKLLFDGELVIYSDEHPLLASHTIYLRGTDRSRDNRTAYLRCESACDATKYIYKVRRALKAWAGTPIKLIEGEWYDVPGNKALWVGNQILLKRVGSIVNDDDYEHFRIYDGELMLKSRVAGFGGGKHHTLYNAELAQKTMEELLIHINSNGYSETEIAIDHYKIEVKID